MSESWEVAYGYVGQELKVIQCASEEEADKLSREIQVSFGSTSNWMIRAHAIEGAGDE